MLENLPIPLDVLAGQDLTELGTKAVEAEKQLKAAEAALQKTRSPTEDAPREQKLDKAREVSTWRRQTITMTAKNNGKPTAKPVVVSPDTDDEFNSEDDEGGEEPEVDLDDIPTSLADEDLGLRSTTSSPIPMEDAVAEGSNHSKSRPPEMPSGYDNDTVVLGLRVYTNKDAPAVVGGQLRHELKASLAALASSAL